MPWNGASASARITAASARRAAASAASGSTVM
jgi:hypothetical protein